MYTNERYLRLPFPQNLPHRYILYPELHTLIAANFSSRGLWILFGLCHLNSRHTVYPIAMPSAPPSAAHVTFRIPKLSGFELSWLHFVWQLLCVSMYSTLSVPHILFPATGAVQLCWQNVMQYFVGRQTAFLTSSLKLRFTWLYTGCPRRNVPDFGRVFLMLKYTDITQNTYAQIWTVTEIMAREISKFDNCYSLID